MRLAAVQSLKFTSGMLQGGLAKSSWQRDAQDLSWPGKQLQSHLRVNWTICYPTFTGGRGHWQCWIWKLPGSLEPYYAQCGPRRGASAPLGSLLVM